MMKIALVLAVFVAVALAAPPDVVPILEYSHKRSDNGEFNLRYKSGDGTLASSQGILKPTADGKDRVLTYTGSHQYIAPDGTPITLNYVADENGFRASGPHLPVAPSA